MSPKSMAIQPIRIRSIVFLAIERDNPYAAEVREQFFLIAEAMRSRLDQWDRASVFNAITNASSSSAQASRNGAPGSSVGASGRMK